MTTPEEVSMTTKIAVAVNRLLSKSLESEVLSLVEVKQKCLLLAPELMANGIEGNLQYIEICQWISIASSIQIPQDISRLNEHISGKTFFVTNKLSLADISLFVAIHGLDIKVHPSLLRWYDHIQSLCATSLGLSINEVAKPPTVFPVRTVSSSTSSSGSKNTDKESKSPSEIPQTTTETVIPKDQAPLNTNAEPAKPKESTKKAKAEKSSESATKKPAASPPAESASEKLDPSKLDIRVGRIVKCWNHPDSEKLLCEEVDLGEGEGSVRQILSGIRKFYNADDLVGVHVMVLANLKERPIAGLKSQGMVLCACTADHGDVKLLAPPTGAKAGDRVTFPGFEGGEPALPNQMAKKKYLENLAPLLRTDENGVARWDSSAFTIGDGVCTSSLANASIS